MVVVHQSGGNQGGVKKCPLWVIRVRVRPAAAPAMSAMPRKRPSATKMRSVAMGHKRTHAPQQNESLFDHDSITSSARVRIVGGTVRPIRNTHGSIPKVKK
jgi:hypothetical protein